MGYANLLFQDGRPIAPDHIRKRVDTFPYRQATQQTIRDSSALDKDLFVRCTARILSNFGMTRAGPFKGVRITKGGNVSHKRMLLECWDEIGDDLLAIRESVSNSGHSRDRYLLTIGDSERESLIREIWRIAKRVLPLTMGETSYGLVGASKILFAILPEIVLPIDNRQWLKVFRTVDLGDVISRMVSDIQEWEDTTHLKLNRMHRSKMLTTLPSVYNVVAMDARSKWRASS